MVNEKLAQRESREKIELELRKIKALERIASALENLPNGVMEEIYNNGFESHFQG